ncbi:MAG: 5-methyltetrahydropteroyltriglutamate--homocysteine S-methyltransferase [Candidatus Binataceae bacterium]
MAEHSSNQTKLNPPFRAEHIGSMLRPPELLAAFKAHRRAAMDHNALREVQDRCIVEVIRLLEEAGLESITDGEFRRGSWAYGFVEALDGFINCPSPWKFHDDEGTAYDIETCYATAKLRRTRGITTDDFEFVRRHTARTPKITMPSPSFMHFFPGTACADPAVYRDGDEFWEDLLRVYQEEIAALAALDATYLQLDEVPQAMLCDASIRAQTRTLGFDPGRLSMKYIDGVNRILKARSATMTVGMHLCRGNFRSRWLARGGYEAVAERLFNETEVDGFFLEYDSERAGDFTPLRFMPRHKFAVLGLVSSKTPKLEDKRALRGRIDEASRYLPLERLALSPQCGFASTVGGNTLSIEDERAKLRLISEVAAEVWR